jgi:hypothetical protein
MKRHTKNRSTNIVRNVSEAGYEYLHATRGWRRLSAKRLQAQIKMAQLLGA